MPCSGVAKQSHEHIVPVLLDMAGEKPQARLVGDQIHCGASKCGNDRRVLLDAGRGLAVELDKLKQVPVEMQRMRIVTPTVKHQTITSSVMEHEFPFTRILFAVDEP